jgi:phosphoserine phosphatase RsbU/P
MRILIAEDDRASLHMVSAVLEKAGYQPVRAANGLEAWEVLSGPEAPAMAILDWVMPEMDGLEVVRRVRERPTRRPPYLIMLTARGEKDDLIAGLGAGANDYLSKPFDPGELRARVAVGRRMVELQEELDERNRDLSRWTERMERELHLAGQVQRNLLSTRPVFTEDVDAQFAYRPSLSIGGDFFDALALPDGRLCLYVGDVSGHGVAPALISTFLKMRATDIVRAAIDEGPAAVCRALNRYMHEHNLNNELFATLFLAVYEPGSRRWRACNCGHPLPMLLGADGAARRGAIPDRGDMPLGIADGPGQYGPDCEIHWVGEPGDTLVCFTDGVYETRHRETGEPCGIDRFTRIGEEVARGAGGIDPDRMLARLEEAGYRIEEDDCCVVSVRSTDADQRVLQREIEGTLEAADGMAAECERELRVEGWPEEAALAARLVLAEYGANVVKHGGLTARDRIRMTARLPGDDTCVLTLREPGPGWDFHGRMASRRAVPEDAESGRGLEMIRRLVRRFDFFRMELYNYARFVVGRDIGSGKGDR